MLIRARVGIKTPFHYRLFSRGGGVFCINILNAADGQGSDGKVDLSP